MTRETINRGSTRKKRSETAFDRLGVPCSHLEVGSDGQMLCNKDIH